METRIIQVFYDSLGYPFKDKERTVRYPISGNAFMGASNTTEIRFYIDRIGGNLATWVANGKLANGEMGHQVLSSSYDNELEEHYVTFTLSAFYTQIKGDLTISLAGYNGGLTYEEVSAGVYEISGTPVIQTTGVIKINIAYATGLIQGEEDEYTFNDFFALLSEKLNTKDGIVVVPSLSYAQTNVGNYEDGQTFYSIEEESLYTNNNGSVDLLYDLNAYRDKIGIFKRSGVIDNSHDLTSAQLTQAKKQFCFMLYTGVTPREIYVKVSGVSSEAETEIKFVKLDDNSSTTNSDKEWMYHYKAFIFDASNGKLNTSIDKTITSYTKSGAESELVTISTTQVISALKTFSVLPQTQNGRVYESGRQLTDKDYVDNAVGVVNTDLTNHKNNTSNPHQVTKAQVGLGNVDNVKQVPNSEKGQSNGVATLDANGKVPTSQIPDSVLGQVEYCGVWDATSNTDQTVRTPRKGDQYTCNAPIDGVGGVYNPDGTNTGIKYVVGDWAVYNGSSWDKIDNTDAVQSVNGKTGAVVLDKTDVGLGNVDNTSDLNKPISTATQNALNTKLGKDEASEDYQAKILHADLTSIATNSWVKDTSVTPNVYRYTSGDLHSILGLVNTNDIAELVGIDAISNNAIGKYGIYLENVTTTNGETYAYICSTFEVEEVVSLAVVITKQYVSGGGVDSVITEGDIGSGLKISNSKLVVDEDILLKLKKHVVTFKVSGNDMALLVINKSATAYTTISDVLSAMTNANCLRFGYSSNGTPYYYPIIDIAPIPGGIYVRELNQTTIEYVDLSSATDLVDTVSDY